MTNITFYSNKNYWGWRARSAVNVIGGSIGRTDIHHPHGMWLGGGATAYNSSSKRTNGLLWSLKNPAMCLYNPP